MSVENEFGIYFYRESEEFGCMSNFYKINFVVDGITYFCTEQYIMKKKQELFDPDDIDGFGINIMNSKSPTKIKGFGRKIRNFNDNIWGEKVYSIGYTGIFAKFDQNSNIRQILCNTNKNLYEASPSDKIWGIGMNAQDAIKNNTYKYGQNLLGKILMQVRNDFKSVY